MKKLLFLIFCAGLFSLGEIYAVPSELPGNNPQGDSECFVPRQIDLENEPPGCLEYLPKIDDCGEIGLDCEYVGVPCPEEPKKLEIFTIDGGYLVWSYIKEVNLKLRDADGNWSYHKRSPANYTFKSFETMRIGECEKFPFLSGLIVRMEGITTNERGEFIVRIPEIK